MDTTFDPPDQFFQAFKAGAEWQADEDGRGAYEDDTLWAAYIAWMNDEGVTT